MLLEDEFVDWIHQLTWEDVPEEVKRHTLMSVLNYLAVGIHGAFSMPAKIALDTLSAQRRNALILGRLDRTDRYTSALVNGIAAHVDDFDDTHLDTVIHPCAPVVSSVIPLLTEEAISGQDFLLSVAIGCEVALRLGMSISPKHYDEGWHITSTCGVVGAAVACSKLLKLNIDSLSSAMSAAGTHAAGLQASFGSMTKALHVGIAAQNGLLGTELASKGLCQTKFSTTFPGSFVAVWGMEFKSDKLMLNPLQPWEFLGNSFKPYPCGVVTHPAIDAGLMLHSAVESTQVESITLHVHPLVLELTNKEKLVSGLEGKFSVSYCVAASVLDGYLSVAHFTDEMIRRSDVIGMQQRITVIPDDGLQRDGCYLTAKLFSGDSKKITVSHATGSRDNPINLEGLLQKSQRLIDPVLGVGRTVALWKELNTHLSESLSLTNFIDLLTEQGEHGDAIGRTSKLCGELAL